MKQWNDFKPKFFLKDKVWTYYVSKEVDYAICDVCKGQGKVAVVGDENLKAECPRCMPSWSHPGRVESGIKHTYELTLLTIGQIRSEITSGENDWPPTCRTEYMAFETGIGSGTLHDEAKLFATKSEAIGAAESEIAALKAPA